MKNLVISSYAKIKTIDAGAFMRKHGNAVLMVFGVMLLAGGIDQIAEANPTINQARVNGAICAILTFIEGAFGALIMVVAGLGAIVAAAMGAYRLAISMLVVAIGAFILRSMLTVFFDDAILNGCQESGTS